MFNNNNNKNFVNDGFFFIYTSDLLRTRSAFTKLQGGAGFLGNSRCLGQSAKGPRKFHPVFQLWLQKFGCNLWGSPVVLPPQREAGSEIMRVSENDREPKNLAKFKAE